MTAGTFEEAVITVLGAAPESIEPGRLHRFAVNGKRSDTAGWCKLFEDGQAGVFGDFRSGSSHFWTNRSRERMSATERSQFRRAVAQARLQRERLQADAWLKARSNIDALSLQTRPVTAGDPVHLYLQRRLASEDLVVPSCIRLHPAAPYVHEGVRVGRWPAMVAPVTGNDGEPRALHRTYLTDDGHKADVPGPVRKLTPACALLSGAAIPLHRPMCGVLGVAEGIETALAASLSTGLPTVAAYSAGNMEGFVWPRGLKQLVIFADHDDAGLKAANGLLERALRAGLRGNISMPSNPGDDWCDTWAAREIRR